MTTGGSEPPSEDHGDGARRFLQFVLSCLKRRTRSKKPKKLNLLYLAIICGIVCGAAVLALAITREYRIEFHGGGFDVTITPRPAPLEVRGPPTQSLQPDKPEVRQRDMEMQRTPIPEGPNKLRHDAPQTPKCVGPTLDEPCGRQNFIVEEKALSIRGPTPTFAPVPGWLPLIIGAPAGIVYEWTSGAKIEWRIDVNQSAPIAPFDGCVVNCQFAPISSVLRGSVGYTFDQSSIYVTAGLYLRNQFLAFPTTGNNPVPNWNVGIGVAYAVQPDLSIWAEYDHVFYGGLGCGLPCSGISQNSGRFSDDRVMFGLRLRLWE
jgi:hypothetical protein